jgi:hypothetical protein
MDCVIQVVERIRTIPGAQVDCGLGQGRDAFLAHVHRLYSKVLDIPLMPDDWYVTEFRQGLSEMQAKVAPNCLPDDYAFFLEYYGGLSIGTSDYDLIVDGIGSMVEEWYGFPMGDDGIYEDGLLAIATLVVQKERSSQRVRFFLDLAGTICQDCVIGIDDRGLERADYASIFQDPYAHTDRWTKLADSFTEWLEQAAATSGTFGYI